MIREQGDFKHSNPWPRIAWGTVAAVFIVSFLIGFFVLGRFQQNGPALGSWAAFCRAIGVTADPRAGKRVATAANEHRHELPGPKTRWPVSHPARSNTALSSPSVARLAMAKVASVHPSRCSPSSPA